MIKYLMIVFVFIVEVATPLDATAQHNEDLNKLKGEIVEVKQNKNLDFIGVLVDFDEKQIRLNINGVGEMYLRRSSIQSIRSVTENSPQDSTIISKQKTTNTRETAGLLLGHSNQLQRRYYFTPNAIPNEKNTISLINNSLIFNAIEFNFLKYYTIDLALLPLFLIPYQNNATAIRFHPKVKYSIHPLVHLGAGYIYYTESHPFWNGIIRGTMTLGNRNMNLSFSFGYPAYGLTQNRIYSISALAMRRGKLGLLFEYISQKTETIDISGKDQKISAGIILAWKSISIKPIVFWQKITETYFNKHHSEGDFYLYGWVIEYTF